MPEELRGKILEEKDPEVLKSWLKLAARSASVEDFCFLLDRGGKI